MILVLAALYALCPQPSLAMLPADFDCAGVRAESMEPLCKEMDRTALEELRDTCSRQAADYATRARATWLPVRGLDLALKARRAEDLALFASQQVLALSLKEADESIDELKRAIDGLPGAQEPK